MTRLTGWQRLWIVLSVLWLVPVVGVASALWPHAPVPFVRSQVRTEYVSAENEFRAIVDIPGMGAVALPVWHPKKDELGVYHMMTDDEITTAALKLYRDDVRSVHQQEVKFVAETAAVWLVPCGAVYALGWAVGWIRRGFAA